MQKNSTGKPELPENTGKFAARVEFIAIKDQIDGLVAKGYSYRAIHDFFTKRKDITMCYATFCNYIKKMKKSVIPNSPLKTTNNVGGMQEKEKDHGEKRKPLFIGGKREPGSPSDIDPDDCK